MKYIIMTLLFSFPLFAQNQMQPGEAIFTKKCAQCHIKMISKDKVLKNIKTIQSPPMIEVSNRLKSMIKITDDIDHMIHRGVVIAFIKDYVMNPDIEKSMCNPMAIDRFGQMPSQKGKINDEDLQIVSEWIYDFYEGKEF